jgi:hypothetical protein
MQMFERGDLPKGSAEPQHSRKTIRSCSSAGFRRTTAAFARGIADERMSVLHRGGSRRKRLLWTMSQGHRFVNAVHKYDELVSRLFDRSAKVSDITGSAKKGNVQWQQQ